MAFRPPVLDWLPRYRRRDFPRDLLAGLLGTLSTAPEAMAYAVLAGLPAQMGLYSLILPLLVYFVLGTSRDLSLAPTGPLAAVLAVAVAPLAAGDPARTVAVALVVTWTVGGLLFAAGLLRLGFVAGFLSRPVLAGYLGGAAVLIAAAQVGVIVGVEADGLNLGAIVRAAGSSWDEANLGSAVLGAGLLALIAVLRRLGLGAIAALSALAAGMAAVALLDLEVAVVGDIPAGLPPLVAPPLGGGAVARVVVEAGAIALLVFLDSTAIARHFAIEKGYLVDPDAELRALGAANLAAGLTGAAPVSGNLGDTVLLAEAGARTPVAGLVTVLLVLGLAVAGANFENMPLAAFAAVVIQGVLRPPHLATLRRTWAFDRAEFWFGALCFAGVIGIGLIRGLLLALAVTVLVLLQRASRPRLVEVGFVREPRPALVDRSRIPASLRFAGALVLQPIGGLFFASAPAAIDRIRVLAGAGPPDLRLVVLDLRAVPFVDLTACTLLDRLERELAGRDVRLLVGRANSAVEEKLRRYGLAERVEAAGGRAELLDLLGLPPDTRDLT